MGKNSLSIVDIKSSKEWDDIVCSFINYDVYSLSGYVKAFQIHGDGIPILFYYESENLRGYNVVMKRDIADDPHFSGKIEKNTWFDIITPYGYGGWLIEGNGSVADLDKVYSDVCINHNIVCEFVRFHPMWDNAYRMEEMYNVAYLGHTVAMDIEDEEVIWNNIISKNRNMIRKAQKNGVIVSVGRSTDDFFSFKRMYDDTMRKDDAESYYFFSDEFYESVQKDLLDNALVFIATYDGRPIAGSIIIYANGKLNYHLSGSDIKYRSMAPTNLLLFEAAKWGSRNGMKTFHLGGGLGSQENSLYKFKKAFYKGEPKQFAIGKKKFLTDIYDRLNSYRTDVPASAFFPEYRRTAKNNRSNYSK